MTTFTVKWMRRGGMKIAHAFVARELEVTAFVTVSPVGKCGVFPVADLVDDNRGAKCLACLRALYRIEMEQRRNALKSGLKARPATETRAGGEAGPTAAAPASSARPNTSLGLRTAA